MMRPSAAQPSTLPTTSAVTGSLLLLLLLGSPLSPPLGAPAGGSGRSWEPGGGSALLAGGTGVLLGAGTGVPLDRLACGAHNGRNLVSHSLSAKHMHHPPPEPRLSQSHARVT
jgi:hypothetical protein